MLSQSRMSQQNTFKTLSVNRHRKAKRKQSPSGRPASPCSNQHIGILLSHNRSHQVDSNSELVAVAGFLTMQSTEEAGVVTKVEALEALVGHTMLVVV